MNLPWPPLLVITDRHQARESLDAVVASILASGCRWVSLREKDLTTGERLALLQRLKGLGSACGATIGIHDDIEAARQAGVVHIHLPAGADPTVVRNRLGENILIGVSAHNLEEIESAQRDGADYCTLSPIFPTPSKPNYGPALGLEGLARFVQRTSLPLLALGGVEVDNLAACLAAGARGAAVMGSLMRAADPCKETQRYLAILQSRHY